MTVTVDVPRNQLWAAFSVKDHCRRGAFIPEVLLYDKLQALYDWQRQFVDANALTDAASIAEAVKQMRALVARLKLARKGQAKWLGLKRFFSFVSVGSKFAALTPPLAVTAAAGGAFASLGTFAVEAQASKAESGGPPDSAVPVAAMILGARDRLGIE